MKRQKVGHQKKLPSRARWRKVLYEVIFEAETPTGRAFDVLFIISVLAGGWYFR